MSACESTQFCRRSTSSWPCRQGTLWSWCRRGTWYPSGHLQTRSPSLHFSLYAISCHPGKCSLPRHPQKCTLLCHQGNYRLTGRIKIGKQLTLFPWCHLGSVSRFGYSQIWILADHLGKLSGLSSPLQNNTRLSNLHRSTLYRCYWSRQWCIRQGRLLFWHRCWR